MNNAVELITEHTTQDQKWWVARIGQSMYAHICKHVYVTLLGIKSGTKFECSLRQSGEALNKHVQAQTARELQCRSQARMPRCSGWARWCTWKGSSWPMHTRKSFNHASIMPWTQGLGVHGHNQVSPWTNHVVEWTTSDKFKIFKLVVHKGWKQDKYEQRMPAYPTFLLTSYWLQLLHQKQGRQRLVHWIIE